MGVISINVAGNSVEVVQKEKALNELAKNLDVDTLNILAKLSTNKVAINTLKNPPTLLKSVLGLK